jgi:tetratricopeptide (TPR) repeat protein
MLHGGKHGAALALASRVLAESRILRTHDLTARAHYLRARALRRMTRYAEAEDALESAILAAERASDPALTARAWSTLIFTVGAGAHRFAEAMSHEVAARAALSRVESVAPADVALLEAALAATQAVQGDYAAAADRFERVLQHRADLTPRRRMNVHYDLALTYTEIGLAQTGLEHARQALALAEVIHGEDHPNAARMLLPVVNALRALDRTTEAVARARTAVAALDAAGSEHPTVDQVLGRLQLALALLENGQLDGALAELEIVDRDAAELGVAARVHGDVLRLRGRAACDLGQRTEAIELLEDSLAALRASPHKPATDELEMVVELARCQRERGDLHSAIAWIDEAESIEFPGEVPPSGRIALLEERARAELASDRAPQSIISAIALLARRVDRPSAAGLVDVLRAHASATQRDHGAAKRHSQSAQRLLAGIDSRRGRLLQAEVDAYLQTVEENGAPAQNR